MSTLQPASTASFWRTVGPCLAVAAAVMLLLMFTPLVGWLITGPFVLIVDSSGWLASLAGIVLLTLGCLHLKGAFGQGKVEPDYPASGDRTPQTLENYETQLQEHKASIEGLAPWQAFVHTAKGQDTLGVTISTAVGLLLFSGIAGIVFWADSRDWNEGSAVFAAVLSPNDLLGERNARLWRPWRGVDGMAYQRDVWEKSCEDYIARLPAHPHLTLWVNGQPARTGICNSGMDNLLEIKSVARSPQASVSPPARLAEPGPR